MDRLCLECIGWIKRKHYAMFLWLDFAVHHSGGGSARSPPTFTKLCQRRHLSRGHAGKSSLRTRLSFYSCPRHRVRVPHRGRSIGRGSSSSTFLTMLPVRSFCSDVLLGRFERLSVPVWLAAGAASQIPGKKKFSTKKAQAAHGYIEYVVLLVCRGAAPVLVVDAWAWATRSFVKSTSVRRGRARGAIPLAIANAGIRSALGSSLPGNLPFSLPW